MKWGNLSLLCWLPVALPLAWALFALLRRRRNAIAQLVDPSMLPVLAPDWNPARAQSRLALRVLAFAALLLALARPQWGFHWEEVRRKGLDLIVVLDTSRSMMASDLAPSRLQQAKWGVRDLLRNLRGDRVGLVPFAGSSLLQCPLTIDYAAFAMTLDDLYCGIIPRGGTAIEQALRAAIAAFPADGQGAYFKDRQGQIVKTVLKEDVLQKLALGTGGTYVRSAPGDTGLERVFNESITHLKRSEQETRTAKIYEERFVWPIAAALLLLAWEALLSDRRKTNGRTVP